jgi:hypothetical protein
MLARTGRIACRLLLIAAPLLAAACGPTVDLSTALRVQDVATGWLDAGIVEGKNKLVPSVSFVLRNTSDQKLPSLQVNALFRRVQENDEWGSGFVTVNGSDGLGPGANTPVLSIRSQLGYTGADQSREEMLHNSHFVDAKVELFAKYGASQWKRIGEYPIARRLISK